MNEMPPEQFEDKEDKDEVEQGKREVAALAKELSESSESFSFPGIDPEAYLKLKTDEEKEEDFYLYSTPIDVLLERFRNEGMRIALGKHPESGNVFIMPSQSNDIESDSLFPRHLLIAESMDERLKQLILLDRNLAR